MTSSCLTPFSCLKGTTRSVTTGLPLARARQAAGDQRLFLLEGQPPELILSTLGASPVGPSAGGSDPILLVLPGPTMIHGYAESPEEIQR